MRSSLLPATLVAFLAGSLGQAQYLISELSFGYSGRLAAPESPGQIANFVLTGQPNTPEVLSNKLILTPVSPGNSRSSVWSELTLLHQSWVIDVDFRASGSDRGGGILNIWLAYNGKRQIGSGSIYRVGKFEGLVLAIDGHGNTGGMLRGFLNDGTTDYSQHDNVDQLAFGHCNFPYRNLGRPSQVKMAQTSDNFRVEIDGKLCFETGKVKIPTGYNLGVSAITPDTPDSFEIFKMVTTSESPKVREGGDQPKLQAPRSDNQGSAPVPVAGAGSGDASWENPADEDAQVFQTSTAQFQDLHHRLQVTNHQLSALFRTTSSRNARGEERHDELKAHLKEIQSQLGKLNEVYELQSRIGKLETEVRGLRQELSQKIVDNERAFRGVLSSHHNSLSQAMVESVPGHGKLISVIIGTNIVFAALYVVYKRRKSSPKKYL